MNLIQHELKKSAAKLLALMLMLSMAPFPPSLLISWLAESETAKSSAWKSKRVLSNSSPYDVLRPLFNLVVNLGNVDPDYPKAYKAAAEADEHKEYDGGETAGRIVPEVGKNGIYADPHGNKDKYYSHDADYMERQIAEADHILDGIFHKRPGGPLGTAGGSICHLIID